MASVQHCMSSRNQLTTVETFDVAFLDDHHLKSSAVCPTNWTLGGLFLLWNEDLIKIENVSFETFFLSAMVMVIGSGSHFQLKTIYGTTRGSLKDAFFLEMVCQKPPAGTRCLVTTDLNHSITPEKRTVPMLIAATLSAFAMLSTLASSRRYTFTWSHGWANPNFKRVVKDALNERVPHAEPCQTFSRAKTS
jgi:hypothetical protein